MVKKFFEWTGNNFPLVLVGIILVYLLFMTAFYALTGVFDEIEKTTNEPNMISSGIVISKSSAEPYAEKITIDENGQITSHIVHHPAGWTITIEGEKGGKTIKYTLDVSESEYLKIDIGDYYEIKR